jgi:FAD/FMN-containing dehydrogenase
MPGALNRRELLRLAALASSAVLSAGRRSTRRVGIQRGRPDWTALQNRIRGQVIAGDSVDYERQRRAMVWNAVKPDRFPAAIVRAASEADVRAAVGFARQHDLKVAVRGGGHNWHNAAIRDGGLLLDLSGLHEVTVDAARRRAVVEPGVMGAAFMGRLAPHGLAFPIPNCRQVGLSGFLLNGGLGRNYRVWGPSCASVDAVDLVDARGQSLHATATQNADWFWAARGAGPGFFGVVTRFYLNVSPLPRAMLRSTLTFSREDSDRLAAWLDRFMPFPAPVQWNCSFVNGAWRIVAIAFTDTIADGRAALKPLEVLPAGFTALTASLYQESSVEAIFGSAAGAFAEGPRYLGDTMVSDASLRDLVAAVGNATRIAPTGSAISFVGLTRPGGSRLPDMAFSMSGATYVHVHGAWRDPALDAANHAWVRSTVASLEPLETGYYVGEADLSIAPDRARQCFSPAAWARLTSLKREHDPENVFFSYLTS